MSLFPRLLPIVAVLVSAGVLAQPVQAQVRRPSPQPSPPQSFQAPASDPTVQAIAALKLQVEALRESVGRQVVALHFETTGQNSWGNAQNSWPQNNQRAEAMCKAALGDHYGRVLSREALPTGDRWYFPNLLCETAP
jgi:hypothetical protein